MKTLIVLAAAICAIFFASPSLQAMQVSVINRTEFSFQADNIGSIERTSESFKASRLDPQLEQIITTTIRQTTDLLPAQYLPAQLEVNVESFGKFTGPDGASENLPLSLVLTTQIPAKNQIRFSNFEIGSDPYSVRTILAHETGHMLMEWACRAVGVASPNESWSKPIYEGVADYISATVNQTTIIGSLSTWFHRDILQYKTLDEAKDPAISLADIAEKGLTEAGLIPRFQSYQEWMARVRAALEQLKMKDPYAEGTWLAGQLWKLNSTKGSKAVFAAVLATTITGEKFDDEEKFLAAVQSRIK